MENNVMERYVAFICNELQDDYNIILNEPKSLDGKHARIKKGGPYIRCAVKITILETYTRSAKLKLNFGESYEAEDIFYMSRHKSPDQLLTEIYNKIDKIVNKTFVEDGREDEIRELYRVKHEDFNKKIAEAFQKLKSDNK